MTAVFNHSRVGFDLIDLSVHLDRAIDSRAPSICRFCMPKRQRIRDPLHDLIEFDGSDFESLMWEALNASEFQRLRRETTGFLRTRVSRRISYPLCAQRRCISYSPTTFLSSQ